MSEGDVRVRAVGRVSEQVHQNPSTTLPAYTYLAGQTCVVADVKRYHCE
jgi:hypothetical protein